jgi:hypothetical protein
VADDLCDVAVGQLRVHVKPELRELQGDIRGELFLGDAVQITLVLVHDPAHGGLVLYAFPKQRGVCAQAFLVQVAQDPNRLVK